VQGADRVQPDGGGNDSVSKAGRAGGKAADEAAEPKRAKRLGGEDCGDGAGSSVSIRP
jgi:hypothetical protein